MNNMTVEMLQTYFGRLGIPASRYGLGRDQDNSLCVVRHADAWIVYFSERGARWDEVSFDTEATAATYFLGLATQDHLDTVG